MKKKLVVCILCGMMAMSALTCGIGSAFAAESPETPVISAQEGEQIPNPWKEYTSVKDAENAVVEVTGAYEYDLIATIVK